MTISNAITETVQSHVYELQYIDCSRLRGPRHSSVLEYARAVGAGGGGVVRPFDVQLFFLSDD